MWNEFIEYLKKNPLDAAILIGKVVVALIIIIIFAVIGVRFYRDKTNIVVETAVTTEAIAPIEEPTKEITEEAESTVVSDLSDEEYEDETETVLEEAEVHELSEEEDWQTDTIVEETGSQVGQAELEEAKKNTNENGQLTTGIDVSKYQGTIDWQKVSEAGIDFAMIRVGYRTSESGVLKEDLTAKYNLQQAQANGIKLGAYFFSSAVTAEEAIEEARWTADFIAKYNITYPVAYNCEGFRDQRNRNYSLNKEARTSLAVAFLEEIRKQGYEPMFYAAKSEMENSVDWDMSQLNDAYKIWVSQYPASPYPYTESASYTGTHHMWQYTNQGNISGISKPVDVNIAYFGYEEVVTAKDQEAPEQVAANVEALMEFIQVNDTVTAKDITNLRSEPSTLNDTVVYVLHNGEQAVRTGICEASGWSRLIYNDAVVYAVSNYLTTDLSPKETMEAAKEESNPFKTTFTEVHETVTAKEVVNLRSMPSVTHEEVQIVGSLSNGETVVRTGINLDYGWSRLEYNGQTVYAISSYLKLAE